MIILIVSLQKSLIIGQTHQLNYKVMPTDYKKALELMSESKTEIILDMGKIKGFRSLKE